MAHLLGLIRALVLLVAVAGAQLASATITPSTLYRADWNGTVSSDLADPAAACLDAGQKRMAYSEEVAPQNSPWTLHSSSYSAPTTCNVVYSNKYSGQVPTTYPVAAIESCPAGSTLSDGTCVCDAGTVEQGGQCVTSTNLCSSLGGKSAGTYNGPGGLGAKQLCVTQVSSGDPSQPGCFATGEATFGYESNLVGSLGVMYWQAQFAFTGAKCNPDANGSTDASGSTPPPPPSPTPSTAEGTQCPIGKVPGEVNGKTICVTPGTDTPQQARSDTNKTETKTDGTAVETSTSKQTVCDATKCTTTTTTTTKTTPPGGTASTTTEASMSTCVVGSLDCTVKSGVGGGGGNGDGTDPSSFGGSCSQTFSCNGDAIMCAVSLEQHKRNCALFVDSSPESNLYGTEKGKTGVQYASENVTISNASFNSSNAFGGSAQCIQDKAITVWGSQVVLPFSQVCDTLAHLGTLLMTVSFLLAFRIVSRG